jgi:hypothetical protein
MIESALALTELAADRGLSFQKCAACLSKRER